MTLQDYLQSLAGKHAAVIGVGISNRPLIRLLREAGVQVTVCDRKDRGALGPWRRNWRRRAAGCGWERAIWMN